MKAKTQEQGEDATDVQVNESDSNKSPQTVEMTANNYGSPLLDQYFSDLKNGIISLEELRKK